MGQVMMLKGADSQQTIRAVKARVEEVQQSLRKEFTSTRLWIAAN
jgi:Cu/Ag efflux pump CusA